MAIDVKSLTQIISDFRKLQSKDSISPESLGAILQRIADLLATAGTSDTVSAIQTLLNGFKAAGQAITTTWRSIPASLSIFLDVLDTSAASIFTNKGI